VFDLTYFNLYTLDEQIDFTNRENIGKRPIRVSDIIYTQFQLQLNQMRDTNNFLIHNSVETRDQIFFSSIREFEFLTLMQEAPMSAASKKAKEYSSYNGIDFLVYEEEVLYGEYFFVSN